RGRHLAVGVDDDADHRRAAAKRDRMTALLAAAATGKAAVGGGPHPLGQPLRHHTTPAVTHAADAMAVAGKARWRQRATAHATPRAIGKYAGKVARHWPQLADTPLPPRNPFQRGKQCPTTAAVAPVWAPLTPARHRPAAAAATPLAMSLARTPYPQPVPSTAMALAAPGLPLPAALRSRG